MTNVLHLAGIFAASLLAMAAPAGAQGDCAPQTHASVPVEAGTPYDVAREELAAEGWEPALLDPADRPEADAASGNAPAFLDQGFDELVACAGTGLAPCRFEFTDSFGNRLAVVTQGEAVEGEPLPAVSQTFFVCEE
ncbi:MAG TPA: hypothetical protein VGN97_01865 [Mesorhizobium sp.]|nr:hypothetical protein [Mesorhizobium sp.]